MNVEFDEGHTVEEASKTRQNAEYELIATTSVDNIKPYTGNTATADHETTHKEFEKIDVQVCFGGDVTEEITVVELKTGHTTLTTSKGTKNKFDEVTAERDKTEELYVEQQNAVQTALATHKYFENNYTVLKKISVQAFIKKDETEVQKYVKS